MGMMARRRQRRAKKARLEKEAAEAPRSEIQVEIKKTKKAK